jgi:[acyl-carrier-protein] S-malonyltransferase
MATAGSRSPGKWPPSSGHEDSVVEALCAEASIKGIVIPANFNCPGQVVASGVWKELMHLWNYAKQVL